MDLTDIEDEVLIEELELRDYVVYDKDDDPADADVSEFCTDELIDELTDREYHIYDKKGECVSDEARPSLYYSLPSSYTIPRNFDRHKLRDHLLNLTGQGSYVSDDELLERIKELLIYG